MDRNPPQQAPRSGKPGDLLPIGMTDERLAGYINTLIEHCRQKRWHPDQIRMVRAGGGGQAEAASERLVDAIMGLENGPYKFTCHRALLLAPILVPFPEQRRGVDSINRAASPPVPGQLPDAPEVSEAIYMHANVPPRHVAGRDTTIYPFISPGADSITQAGQAMQRTWQDMHGSVPTPIVSYNREAVARRVMPPPPRPIEPSASNQQVFDQDTGFDSMGDLLYQQPLQTRQGVRDLQAPPSREAGGLPRNATPGGSMPVTASSSSARRNERTPGSGSSDGRSWGRKSNSKGKGKERRK